MTFQAAFVVKTLGEVIAGVQPESGESAHASSVIALNTMVKDVSELI